MNTFNPQPDRLLVAFDDESEIRCAGMWCLLQEIFTVGMNIPLQRISPGCQASGLADIYVSRFSAGMERLCHPELKRRKQNALLIIVSEGGNRPESRGFSPCLQGSVVLRKNDGLASIRKKIIQGWNSRAERGGCGTCCLPSLSTTEVRVAYYLCKGMSSARAGKMLGMDDKQVSAFKRGMMSKFNLHNTAEFVAFMPRWRACMNVDAGNVLAGPLPQRAENSVPKRPVSKSGAQPVVLREEAAREEDKDETKKDTVLRAVRALCGATGTNNCPRTRDIADACNDSVYVIRYWLGLLEKDGLIQCISNGQRGRGSSLHWYCDSAV